MLEFEALYCSTVRRVRMLVGLKSGWSTVPRFGALYCSSVGGRGVLVNTVATKFRAPGVWVRAPEMRICLQDRLVFQVTPRLILPRD